MISKILISNGINIFNILLYFLFLYFYRTALHAAIQRKDLEIIKLLMDNEKTCNLTKYVFKQNIIFL